MFVERFCFYAFTFFKFFITFWRHSQDRPNSFSAARFLPHAQNPGGFIRSFPTAFHRSWCSNEGESDVIDQDETQFIWYLVFVRIMKRKSHQRVLLVHQCESPSQTLFQVHQGNTQDGLLRLRGRRRRRTCFGFSSAFRMACFSPVSVSPVLMLVYVS